MIDYYALLRLNRKEYKIMEINEESGIIRVKIGSTKNKVRCPICNQYTKSVHSKLKPIRSVYLDSCGQKVELIILKRRF